MALGDKDNIIGFVHIKDIYNLFMSEKKNELKAIVRPVQKVPESIHISDLLKLMQRKKTHMAIVIDEYGGTSGLVTIEDILRKLSEKFKMNSMKRNPILRKRGKNYSRLDGRLLIEEVNDRFGIEIKSEDYDTIGGWFFFKVETPPEVGQCLFEQGYELKSIGSESFTELSDWPFVNSREEENEQSRRGCKWLNEPCTPSFLGQ